ncbi:GTPase inhibitor [Daedaleopsis nitida]|nr:GTPase inhibitor [Daedaleopsis nitida]
MPDQDTKISSLVARLNEPSTSGAHASDSVPEMDDDDSIFAELEAEIENDSSAAVREHGMERLTREMDQLRQMKSDGHGQYREVTEEKDVVRLSAKEPRCVVHFFHHKFKRCEIMDKHLQRLAPKYFGTLFIRVFVENVPWLVERLGVKVLPCVMTFINGTSRDRIIGFEDLGNSDQFETATLEWKLLNSGAVQKDDSVGSNIVYGANSTVRKQIRGEQQQDDDSDLDLD